MLLFPILSRTGDTGLEIRGDGSGSSFPVGVHDRLCGGDLRDHLPGAFSLRYSRAYRSALLRDQDGFQHHQTQLLNGYDALVVTA